MASTAQPYPSPILPHVNDFAQLLDAEGLAKVHGMLKSLKADTGIQLTLIKLGSQASYARDKTLEEFATNLFNNWGIGDAARNDGILVLVLPNDRAMRIELGAGYDASWKAEVRRAISRSYLPSFRSEIRTCGQRRCSGYNRPAGPSRCKEATCPKIKLHPAGIHRWSFCGFCIHLKRLAG